MIKLLTVLFFIFLTSINFAWEETGTVNTTTPSPPSLTPNKQTTLGLYATAKEAYQKWYNNPGLIKILDVRTPEEYLWIGHPEMAHNIPYMFFKEKWYTNPEVSPFINNPDFVTQVKNKFKPTDTIYLICRSGGRSASAANILAKEGFNNVYSVIDGFEGDEIKDENSCYKGKRMMNGWKNSGAPWTYESNQELIFRLQL